MRRARGSLTATDWQDLAIGGVVSMLTYVISRHYTAGDQVGYEEAYRAVRGIDPVLAARVYERFISTVEFVHFVIVYAASNFVIEKNLFFSLLNGVFAIVCARAMRTMGVSLYLIVIFIFANYYAYVCYFAAERLKIALIFFIAASLVLTKVNRYLLYMLSIMSHVTVLLLLAGRIMQKILDLCRRSQTSRAKAIAELAFFVAAISVALYFFGDYALWKFYQYYEKADNSVVSALPILVYIVASFHYAERKSEVFIDFIPLAIAFTVLGGSRINMFAYFTFLKYGLQCNRGFNAGVLATSLYLTYKSIIFIQTVFETGQGF